MFTRILRCQLNLTAQNKTTFPTNGYGIVISILFTVASIQCKGAEMALWFNKPGKSWENDSLPLGNGYMGASVLGGINEDVITIAEKTLWTGGPGSQQGYDTGLPGNPEEYHKSLQQVQDTLFASGSLSPELVADELGHAPSGYGSFQTFGNLVIRTSHSFNQVTEYSRQLDLPSSTSKTSYFINGVKFTREYFLSYPDNVFVVKLSASEPGKISAAFALDFPENRSAAFKVSNHEIGVTGSLNDNELEYAANLEVISKNGTSKSQGNSISVTSADEVILYFNAATNYLNEYPDYRGQAAVSKLSSLIELRQGESYSQLRQKHIDDVKQLYNRVHLDIKGIESEQPTDVLLQTYKNNTAAASEKRFLEELYYHYGRYLLIASSRQGSLPANLQGVWNNYEDVAPWNGDYHFNINLQMNYWLADITNLSELNEPLFDFVESLIPPGKKAAKALLNSDGWTVFLNSNIWGFSGTIAWPTAFWQPEAGAWLASHFYSHYQFTRDEKFLRERAWPVLREATEFWLDTLEKDPKTSSWVVVPSFSPEHGDFVVGAAMSQQVVTQLFRDSLYVAQHLKLCSWVKRLTPVLTDLEPGLKVGSWGQLQEWREDIDDKESHHRHVSQLYALHPGSVITPDNTPKLAEAAKVTLNARGDGGTGWSKAWKINFWARLGDGDRAHKLLSEQLKESTLDNLWDNHPPFQIDGNFGATSGMSEMLLQSHAGQIHLLPALPSEWKDGEVSGLKARGGIEFDILWKNSQLINSSLASIKSQTLTIKNDSFLNHVSVSSANAETVWYPVTNGQITINVEAGVEYTLSNSAKQASEQ